MPGDLYCLLRDSSHRVRSDPSACDRLTGLRSGSGGARCSPLSRSGHSALSNVYESAEVKPYGLAQE